MNNIEHSNSYLLLCIQSQLQQEAKLSLG